MQKTKLYYSISKYLYPVFTITIVFISYRPVFSNLHEKPSDIITNTVETRLATIVQAQSSPPPILQNSTHVPVLMYHHIKTNNQPNNKVEAGLDVPPDQFEQQIISLSENNFQSIISKDIFLASSDKSIAITFDDGYDDVYNNAFPILKKYGFKATVFIITGYVGRDGYLTWDQIKELQSSGWEIGSHTVSHLDLSKISTDQIKHQISDSKNTLESNLNKTIFTICYPAGKYNDEVIQIVKDSGYLYAYTTKSGKENNLDQPFTLKRVRINGSDGINTFINKVVK